MALAATFVLIGSNVVVAAIRKVVPSGVRIPCYIVVIATFVTIAEFFMKAFAPPEVNKQIGIFIPLIVVNCIIMGRAEAFAQKNSVGNSLLDALGLGAGYLGSLLLLACIREPLGTGKLAGQVVLPGFNPLAVVGMAPGAFLIMGFLLGFFIWIGQMRKAK
jgi:electron transport complex protein RnfE